MLDAVYAIDQLGLQLSSWLCRCNHMLGDMYGCEADFKQTDYLKLGFQAFDVERMDEITYLANPRLPSCLHHSNVVASVILLVHQPLNSNCASTVLIL